MASVPWSTTTGSSIISITARAICDSSRYLWLTARVSTTPAERKLSGRSAFLNPGHHLLNIPLGHVRYVYNNILLCGNGKGQKSDENEDLEHHPKWKDGSEVWRDRGLNLEFIGIVLGKTQVIIVSKQQGTDEKPEWKHVFLKAVVVVCSGFPSVPCCFQTIPGVSTRQKLMEFVFSVKIQ